MNCNNRWAHIADIYNEFLFIVITTSSFLLVANSAKKNEMN